MAREEGPVQDGVLQAGAMAWTYKCSMVRFQLFAASIRGHFWNAETGRCSGSVRFKPGFDVMNGASGVAEASFLLGVESIYFPSSASCEAVIL